MIPCVVACPPGVFRGRRGRGTRARDATGVPELQSDRRCVGRQIIAVVLALGSSLGLVAAVLSLPPPGFAATRLDFTFLTFGNWNDRMPAWSPDGSAVAYVSDQNGVWQVFTMKPDGTSDKAVTPSSYAASFPTWRPDSSALAFWTQSGSKTDIRVLFVGNSTTRSITSGGYSVLQKAPKWSPDGRRLLFYSTGSTTALLSYDFETGSISHVADVQGNSSSASWLSDTEVVFSAAGAPESPLMWADVANASAGVYLQWNASILSPAASISTWRTAFISDVVPPNPYGRSYIGAYRPGDYVMWVAGLDGSNATFEYGWVPKAGEAVPGIQYWQMYPCPYTPGLIVPSQDMKWSPDGNIVAFAALNGTGVPQVYLWDVFRWTCTTGALAWGIWNSTDPAWGPAGGSLLVAASQSGYYHIVEVNATNLAQALPFGARDA